MSATHPTRRDFLRATAAGAAGLAVAGTTFASAVPAIPLGKAKSCIFINLVGGPAHLDTFDPKPNAPVDVSGPFKPIQTKVPGLHLSELFPKLAAVSNKFALVRSMHHQAPPVHECGFQLLNTGRLFRDGPEWPSVGSVVTHLTGRNCVVTGNARDITTGISVSHGQTAGWLGIPAEPMRHYSAKADLPYLFETASDWAQRVGGVQVVNQFPTVFDSPSWDCHADGGSLRTTLADVRNIVAPSFDAAFSQLLIDLDERGMLESTLVVATGEFGRTPKLNSNGGRDHWAVCWTALVAGGGVKGGQVIGASDATGSEPVERPVSPQELVSTIFAALGISSDATIPGPDGAQVRVYPGEPIAELF